MLDIGWTELMVIGVVALIVIGPKDLPEMFRTLGRFTAKARGMAREFQRAMETAANEAGVKDIAKDLKNVTSAKSLGLDAVKDAATKFEKWDPLKNAAKPTAPPPPRTPPVAAADIVPPAAAPMGPATQALADKQAAKKAIVQEAADKLRAASAGSVAESVPAEAPKPARKPRAPKADAGGAAAPPKPRAPRKPAASKGDA
ncbi:MAG: Sec-independent protein translocase protein TatB [Pseudomonadota bacterium]